MADAGRMPDDPNALTWADAFHRLPGDAPEASAWPAMAARVAARGAQRARRRRVLWGGGMALAASLALVAVVPMLRTPSPGESTPVPAPAPLASAPAQVATGAIMADSTAVPPTLAMPAPRVTPPPAARVASRASRRQPSHINVAVTTPVPTTRDASMTSPASTVIGAETGESLDLGALYATSRELEALLAATRDPRVASGPAAALASEYDAALATIDARLANPDLRRDEQAALWQARVATLREATGFETSQRVLAARGDTYGGALVRVD